MEVGRPHKTGQPPFCHADRETEMTWRRELLVIAYERAAHHCTRSARIYQALAEREPDSNRKAILQMSSERDLRRSEDYARRLSRLLAHPLYEEDARTDRLWRWLFLLFGNRAALTWLDWDEKNYLRLFGILASSRRPR